MAPVPRRPAGPTGTAYAAGRGGVERPARPGRGQEARPAGTAAAGSARSEGGSPCGRFTIARAASPTVDVPARPLRSRSAGCRTSRYPPLRRASSTHFPWRPPRPHRGVARSRARHGTTARGQAGAAAAIPRETNERLTPGSAAGGGWIWRDGASRRRPGRRPRGQRAGPRSRRPCSSSRPRRRSRTPRCVVPDPVRARRPGSGRQGGMAGR
jgi:hypothetical protein